MPFREIRKLREENADLKRQLQEAEDKIQTIGWHHLDFCERVRDGGFVRIPPPDLKLVEKSQTKGGGSDV